MDKKILLQNLADSFSARTGMTKRKAETFVRSFFEITEEGILSDGIVKVKGFGTTKVIKVSDRESVNINTGERFQIDGHAKVTFTPDAPFKDLVNRPFAQFTTIVLEDDVDLEELNAVDDPAEEEPSVTPTQEVETAVPTEAPEKEVPIVEETSDEEEAAPEKEAALEVIVAPAEEEAPAEEDAVPQEDQAPEDMQQPIIIQNTMPAPPAHNWWRIAFFTLLTILLMVASYFAGYYRIFCPCTSDSTGEQPVVSVADTTSTAEPQEVPKAQQAPAATPKAEAEAAAEAPVQPKEEQVQTAQPKEAAPQSPAASDRAAAKKYRQMEGGEYLITGVIETHKMAAGDNLYKLARKAYGDKKLASYIIFHNQISNPDLVQLGENIEIPKLTHK